MVINSLAVVGYLNNAGLINPKICRQASDWAINSARQKSAQHSFESLTDNTKSQESRPARFHTKLAIELQCGIRNNRKGRILPANIFADGFRSGLKYGNQFYALSQE